MRRYALSILASSLLMLSQAAALASSVTVAVSANMQFAFADIGAAFTKETGIEVKSVTGSSGKLAAQIQSGAPFDVFVSADTDYPTSLDKRGLTEGAPVIYAYGVLVLWTLSDIDLAAGLSALADPRVKKIAFANPRTAPYGREAVRALESADLAKITQNKLVIGESIGQVNQYITTRAVDIGFTAKSIVLAPSLRGLGTWREVPKNSYTPIGQSAVVLKHGKEINADASHRLMSYLLSTPARTILSTYGYILP